LIFTLASAAIAVVIVFAIGATNTPIAPVADETLTNADAAIAMILFFIIEFLIINYPSENILRT
jgi:NADH:ubiquinone oxidoreductase subunit 6 (subunit J)